MKAHNILIADDHQVVINGLKGMLQEEEAIHVCCEVLEPDMLEKKLSETNAEILILDINMKDVNMLKKVPQLKKQFPELKVIIFTSYHTPSLWKEAKSLGVHSFLPKNTGKEKLIQTIFQVLAEEPTDFIVDNQVIGNSPVVDSFVIKELLSNRELEVLKLVAQGNTSQQIAEMLFVSKHTVQWHRKNIIAKLKLNSASDLVRIAFESGLV